MSYASGHRHAYRALRAAVGKSLRDHEALWYARGCWRRWLLALIGGAVLLFIAWATGGRA